MIRHIVLLIFEGLIFTDTSCVLNNDNFFNAEKNILTTVWHINICIAILSRKKYCLTNLLHNLRWFFSSFGASLEFLPPSHPRSTLLWSSRRMPYTRFWFLKVNSAWNIKPHINIMHYRNILFMFSDTSTRWFIHSFVRTFK